MNRQTDALMKVTIEYLGHIRATIGSKREEEVEIRNGFTVADLLTILSKEYGEPFRKAVYETGKMDIKSNFMATVNGYLLNQLNGVQTKLKDGDRIILMPVVSGG